MTPRYTIASKSVCELVQQRSDKLFGYPREGVDGGPLCGKHDRERGLGWTLHQYAIEIETDTDGKVVPEARIYTRCPDPDTEGDAKRLTAAELAYLRTKYAAAEKKPAALPAKETPV